MGLKRRFILQITHPNTRYLAAGLTTILAWQVLGNVHQTHPTFKYLISYNLAMFIYLALLFIRVGIATPLDTQQISQRQEPSNLWIVFGVVILSLGSIAALVTLADTPKNWPPIAYQLHVLLSLSALFLSWLLVHTFFGLHYARRYYYRDTDELGKPFLQGLQFPGEGNLVHYWEFLYFSFSIAMCYGTTDVDILSREMRVVTLFHSVFSFMYVLIILGLVVNFISNIF
jgi:uncharacterized membrane protein